MGTFGLPPKEANRALFRLAACTIKGPPSFAPPNLSLWETLDRAASHAILAVEIRDMKWNLRKSIHA
jgi:hypothetical protein